LRIRPRRLFSYRRLVVRRLERGDGDATLAVLSIDGLVCGVCVARAQRALVRAVEGEVLLRPVRRWLARLRWGAST